MAATMNLPTCRAAGWMWFRSRAQRAEAHVCLPRSETKRLARRISRRIYDPPGVKYLASGRHTMVRRLQWVAATEACRWACMLGCCCLPACLLACMLGCCCLLACLLVACWAAAACLLVACMLGCCCLPACLLACCVLGCCCLPACCVHAGLLLPACLPT